MAGMPTFFLKCSEKAERDMQASWASSCTVQPWPGRSCMAVMTALNCRSDRANSQPTLSVSCCATCRRSISISIICARCSPSSVSPGCGSCNTAIMRSKYHCMTARSAGLRRCTSAGSNPSSMFACSAAKVKKAVSPRHAPPPCQEIMSPCMGPVTTERTSTGGSAKSLARRNAGPWGRATKSPACSRTASSSPSIASQHWPVTSAKHRKQLLGANWNDHAPPASMPPDI